MERDEYEDYLVDKAKDLMRDAAKDVEDANHRSQRIARKEVEQSAPDSDDAEQQLSRMRAEADVMAHRRSSMDNDELREFLAGESEFHELMRDVEQPAFSDWEKRVLITRGEKDPEELAEELDRSVDAIKYQLKILGLDR